MDAKERHGSFKHYVSAGKVLTLSHMASKVPFTIWQGGWRDTPKRTTLAQVETILEAYWPPAMPWPAGE
jgi:hypothetical protein